MNNHRSKNYHLLVVPVLTSRIINHLIFEWHCQSILSNYFHVTVPFKEFRRVSWKLEMGGFSFKYFSLLWTGSNGVSAPAQKSFKSAICYETANGNLWTSQNIRRNNSTESWYLATPRRFFSYVYSYSLCISLQSQYNYCLFCTFTNEGQYQKSVPLTPNIFSDIHNAYNQHKILTTSSSIT